MCFEDHAVVACIAHTEHGTKVQAHLQQAPVLILGLMIQEVWVQAQVTGRATHKPVCCPLLCSCLTLVRCQTCQLARALTGFKQECKPAYRAPM